MKQNIGELSEAELKARRRFWNKRGFFGEPTRKQIESWSLKMQKLVKALKTFSLEEVKKIRATKSLPRYFAKLEVKEFTTDMLTVLNASESDFNHAVKTFKIL